MTNEEFKKIHDLETELYINRMRLKSTESSIITADPYSDDFDYLICKALQLKDDIGCLEANRIQLLKRLI